MKSWQLPARTGAAETWSNPSRNVSKRRRCDNEVDRRTPIEPIDVRDAMRAFERSNPTRGCPPGLCLALSAEFVCRIRPWEMAGYLRRHGIKADQNHVDAMVVQAIAEVAWVLRSRAVL